MRMYDLIQKKKRGGALTPEELNFLVSGFTQGEIPDSQMSAFLMAVCFQGMSPAETADFTLAMARSGDWLDLSTLPGTKVDKHSTGGVGDKTTLIVAPMAAACQMPVAKMSGRGLGHTGGTIDKLEAIPGFQATLAKDIFLKIVSTVGLCVASQSGQLVPADKKIYALRDATATVDSIPLIAASIMSKKIAAGSDCILLDVKTGSGAFMKTLEEALRLARTMVEIGEACGRKTMALVTQMDQPLGRAVGNALEVMEAVETLQGKGPEDVTRICIELTAHMLELAGKGEIQTCRERAARTLEDGSAFAKWMAMVQAQGGDTEYLTQPSRFPLGAIKHRVKAQQSGYLVSMDTESCGTAAALLGAGRETIDGAIDPGAGILLLAKPGDWLSKGEDVAVLYTQTSHRLSLGLSVFEKSFQLSPQKPRAETPLVYAKVWMKNGELQMT